MSKPRVVTKQMKSDYDLLHPLIRGIHILDRPRILKVAKSHMSGGRDAVIEAIRRELKIIWKEALERDIATGYTEDGQKL